MSICAESFRILKTPTRIQGQKRPDEIADEYGSKGQYDNMTCPISAAVEVSFANVRYLIRNCSAPSNNSHYTQLTASEIVT